MRGRFHATSLTYWRRRLAASDQPNRIFDAVKAVVAQTGALTGKTRRALDSTVLDDAVATQDTVIQLIAAIRRVRREVSGAAEVIAVHCTAHGYDDPGKPSIAWDDPDARDRLIDALVTDAHRVLGHLPDQELGVRAAESVALLALVAGQDVEPVEGSDGTDGRWRIAQQVAPDRVISTVDPDARHVHKTVQRRRDGYKAHLAVEPDTGIITDCALTKANGADNHEAAVGLRLLETENSPVTVLADSAYGAGDFRAELADQGHIDRVKPAPNRRVIPGGFTIDDFTVDHAARSATCPNGLTRPISRTGFATFGTACAAARPVALGSHHADRDDRSRRMRSEQLVWRSSLRASRPTNSAHNLGPTRVESPGPQANTVTSSDSQLRRRPRFRYYRRLRCNIRRKRTRPWHRTSGGAAGRIERPVVRVRFSATQPFSVKQSFTSSGTEWCRCRLRAAGSW